jgi:acetyl esterase
MRAGRLGRLGELTRAGSTPIREMTVEEARALTGRCRDRYGPGSGDGEGQERAGAGPGGHVPYRLLIPSENPLGVIVYYHGGGWVIGALDDFETLGRTSPSAPAAP